VTQIEFPRRSPLSGTDFFLLALDRNMRKNGTTGNVCHLGVDLHGSLSRAEMLARCQELQLLQWLNSVSIRRRWPLQIPHWQKSSTKGGVLLHEHFQDDGIPEEIFQRALAVRAGATLAIDLIQRGSHKTTVVISWHHALMDAHGAEMLLRHIAEAEPTAPGKIFPTFPANGSLISQLGKAKEAKDLVVSASRNPVALLKQPGASGDTQLKFRLVEFSAAETAAIDQTAVIVGAGFRKSVLYLAAAALSLRGLFGRRDGAESAFCVPVPQDQRRRGATGPVVSNQVSFFFYRIPYDQLGSLQSAVQCISTQMLEQMRGEKQKSYATMMTLFRRLPLGVYAGMLKTSTNQNSFHFSDTGESLSGFTSFLGRQVERVVHYPPCTYPPGFTIVFMRYQGRLSATIRYASKAISEEELAWFVDDLRSALLNGGAERGNP